MYIRSAANFGARLYQEPSQILQIKPVIVFKLNLLLSIEIGKKQRREFHYYRETKSFPWWPLHWPPSSTYRKVTKTNKEKFVSAILNSSANSKHVNEYYYIIHSFSFPLYDNPFLPPSFYGDPQFFNYPSKPKPKPKSKPKPKLLLI